MLQNTLLKIRSNTNLQRLTRERQENLFRVLSFYKTGQTLYPGMIIRHTGFTMTESYLLLDQIEKMGIIERAYEVYCPHCRKSTGDIYSSLNDIPTNIPCESCDMDIVTMNCLLVVYKVLVE